MARENNLEFPIDFEARITRFKRTFKKQKNITNKFFFLENCEKIYTLGKMFCSVNQNFTTQQKFG